MLIYFYFFKQVSYNYRQSDFHCILNCSYHYSPTVLYFSTCFGQTFGCIPPEYFCSTSLLHCILTAIELPGTVLHCGTFVFKRPRSEDKISLYCPAGETEERNTYQCTITLIIEIHHFNMIMDLIYLFTPPPHPSSYVCAECSFTIISFISESQFLHSALVQPKGVHILDLNDAHASW